MSRPVSAPSHDAFDFVPDEARLPDSEDLPAISNVPALGGPAEFPAPNLAQLIGEPCGSAKKNVRLTQSKVIAGLRLSNSGGNMEHLKNFVGDDAGAVTVDWIALTFGILLAGIVTIYAIYWTGVSNLITEVSVRSVSFISDLDPGEVPDVNP